jgi:hypothetical protein
MKAWGAKHVYLGAYRILRRLDGLTIMVTTRDKIDEGLTPALGAFARAHAPAVCVAN